MTSTLRDVRKAFGWSQEQLAEALGKDVATISRWERGKTRAPMTGTLIEQIARNGISGRTTRLQAYIDVVMSPHFRAAVEHHPGLRYIVFGPRLTLLLMSRIALEGLPLPGRILVGSDFDTYMSEESLAVYRRALPLLQNAEEQAKKLQVVRTYARYDGSRISGHPRVFREFIWTTPYPHVYDVSARNISEEEFNALPDLLVMVQS